MSKDEPTVIVKLSDYDRLRDDVRHANDKIATLERQLVEAKLIDPNNTIKQLHEAFHEAIKVVQFAVGNLDPQTVRGWPHQALTQVAKAIETTPGIDMHIRELPDELRAFAGTAAGLEEFRKQRDANRMVTPAGPGDYGPKTAEAMAVHAYYTTSQTPAQPQPQVQAQAQPVETTETNNASELDSSTST